MPKKMRMIETLFTLGAGSDGARVALTAGAVSVSVAYLALVNGGPSALRTVVKTLPMVMLSLLVLSFLRVSSELSPDLILLALALALSALGDFFLALKDQSRFFVLGLGSFLLAHVAYLALFLRLASLPSTLALVVIAACFVSALLSLYRAYPHMGRLKVPVFAYFGVIMAMVAAALSIPHAPWWLGFGAALFAFSDSLIAVRKFLAPFALINEAIWVTYVVAQFLILGAMLQLIIP
ncbi:MAG: lysoplasmalogenase, partial [Burkholderiales bacterium]